ncbi:hypothetical protein Tco_0135191 [Tanacetum coccineum]
MDLGSIFFDQLCSGYDVLKFIRGTPGDATPTSTSVPFTPDELKVDKIILSLIFTTISDPLQKRLAVARPNTAKEAWDILTNIVKDNKQTRASTLKTELRSIQLGTLNVAHYAITGVLEKYNQVCGYMNYQNTFPNLKTVRSLLVAEEMRLKTKEVALPADSSSPMVLMAQTGVSSVQGLTSFQPRTSGSITTPRHATLLPQAFSVGTLHNPNTDAWNMDTGLYDTPGASPIEALELSILRIFSNPACFFSSQFSIRGTNLGIDVLCRLVSNNDILGVGSVQGLTSSQPGTSGSVATPGHATLLPQALLSTLHDPNTGASNMDTDHAGCNDDCKSTYGGIQFLGEKIVSWSSKKQDCTAMSSEEAEYVSLSTCCAQVIWMRTQLLDYGFCYNKILIFCDSQSAMVISCNPVQHSRTKHINIHYHFIKEHVEKGTIELYFVGTEYQLADLFTKALPKERFEILVHKIVFQMAQNVIPADQLVTEVKPIERCNNYAVLQSISCSPECKIVRQLLLDHLLSYALTATDDVPVVVGYQGVVDKVSAFYTKYLAQPWQTMFKKKEAIQYPRFIKLIITDVMMKFPNIPKRLEEDYHSIKDDILLISVYTTGNVLVRGMLILDAFLTDEIRETNDFKEGTPRALRSLTVSASPQENKKRKQTGGESSSTRIIIKKRKQTTPSIPPLGDDRERDALAEATLLSLTLHKTALEAEARENIAKVQEKLDEEEIERIVEGEEDEESYASAFADCVFNDDVDDTGCKIEPGSHKEKLENIDDDVVEIEKETNVDDTSDKLLDEVVKEKEVNMSRSQEIRKEQKQTLIPSPIRSPRNVSSLDKTISEELTADVSPTTATTSKILSKLKQKKKSFTHKARNLPGSIAGMSRQR